MWRIYEFELDHWQQYSIPAGMKNVVIGNGTSCVVLTAFPKGIEMLKEIILQANSYDKKEDL